MEQSRTGQHYRASFEAQGTIFLAIGGIGLVQPLPLSLVAKISGEKLELCQHALLRGWRRALEKTLNDSGIPPGRVS